MQKLHKNNTETRLQIPKYTRRMLYSSTTTVASIFSAWEKNLYHNCFLSLLVLSTSILYWSHPTNGWRRNIDMICTNGAIGFQVVYSASVIPTNVRLQHGIMVFILGITYFAARHFGRTTPPDFDKASKCHVMLHICGNLSNLFLYNAMANVYSQNSY